MSFQNNKYEHYWSIYTINHKQIFEAAASSYDTLRII